MPSCVQSSLLGVVLNGGQSSRMGRDKSSLQLLDGNSFQEFAVQRLHTVCQQVVISVHNNPVMNLPSKTNIIVDQGEGHGPMVGMLSSLTHADQNGLEGCIFTPIDTPLLRPEDLKLLLDAWVQSPEKPVCAVNQSEMRLEPLISIIPATYRSKLRVALKAGNFSVFKWMLANEAVQVTIEPERLKNVNHPSDLIHLNQVPPQIR